MREIKSPKEPKLKENEFSIFLGGTIDMGKSENWQAKLSKDLSKLDNVVLLNPRRDDWDDTWTQSIENKQFNEQVSWELKWQEESDLIIYYFGPESKSPITLLELGLFGTSKPTIVCCPEGFYRKGNVDIVCDRYDVPLVESYDELITEIKNLIKK